MKYLPIILGFTLFMLGCDPKEDIDIFIPTYDLDVSYLKGKIVYQGSDGSLYSNDLQGGDEKMVSSGGGTYESPKWSPNGDSIIYLLVVPGTLIGRDPYIVNSDGSDKHLILQRNLGIIAGIDWSPNGKWFAVAEVKFFIDSSVTSVPSLKIIPLRSDSIETVANISAEPIISPDKKKIAYSTTSNPSTTGDINVIDLNTKEITKVAENSWGRFCWSPDSKSIAYCKFSDTKSFLFLVDIETKMESELDQILSQGWGPYAWSHDQDHIIYGDGKVYQISSGRKGNLHLSGVNKYHVDVLFE